MRIPRRQQFHQRTRRQIAGRQTLPFIQMIQNKIPHLRRIRNSVCKSKNRFGNASVSVKTVRTFEFLKRGVLSFAGSLHAPRLLLFSENLRELPLQLERTQRKDIFQKLRRCALQTGMIIVKNMSARKPVRSGSAFQKTAPARKSGKYRLQKRRIAVRPPSVESNLQKPGYPRNIRSAEDIRSGNDIRDRTIRELAVRHVAHPFFHKKLHVEKQIQRV